LPTHYVDKAIRLYSLALQRSFLYGRRQVHVVAAVIYTVARQESSPHLLIDFSDMLQVNVYVLGQCFLQLTRLLSLRLQIIDPCLYIHRFAARLDLGAANVGAIAVTALRAMTRMKRDWMSTGRRPDGLCAAALLIAARAHGFDRGIHDMASLFRISVNTIARRLQEFRLTPSAQLTVSQFHQQQRPDTAAMPEFDPPAYVQNVLDESLQVQMAAAATTAGGYHVGAMGAGEVVVPLTIAASSAHHANEDDGYRSSEGFDVAGDDGAMMMKLSSRPK
jgi:transcription factor IIIB subunit 2